MVTIPNRSLVEHIQRRLSRRQEDPENGSLVLDILIGMAVFALVAIIAVSAVGQHRSRAYEQSAVSDAGSLGVTVEAVMTDTAALAADGTVPMSQDGHVISIGDETVVLSHQGANVLRNWSAPEAANGYTFSFCIVHNGTEWARYDSSDGGLVDRGRSTPPAACGTD